MPTPPDDLPEPLRGRPWFVFGSPDSRDRDVLYAVESLPALETAKRWCQSAHENRNLIVVEDGIIRACFKGNVDETHNALLRTYELHAQAHPLPLTRPLPRLVPLKAVRAIRMVLSHLTRTRARAQIKAALRSLDQQRRVALLGELELAALEAPVDAWKSVAFQLVQLLALADGAELYTKASAAAFAPGVARLLAREPATRRDLEALGELRDRVLEALSVAYTRRDGALNVFCYRSSNLRTWSRYAAQCRGVVIDLQRERCLVMPYEKFFQLDERDGWRRADLAGRTPDEIVEKIDGSLVSLFRHEGALRFASKGSFDSPATRAAERLASRYPLARLELDRFSHVFEVVYEGGRFPQGFTSVRYEHEALYLIGMRDRVTGELAPYAEVIARARALGLPHPRRFAGSFEEAIAACDDPRWRDAEGWIANFQGQRVKLKHRAYLQTSDVINGVKRGSGRILRAYLRLPADARARYGEFMPPDLRPHLERELAPYREGREALVERARRYLEEVFTGDLSALAERLGRELEPAYHRLVLRLARAQPHDEALHRAVAWTLTRAPSRRARAWDMSLEADQTRRVD